MTVRLLLAIALCLAMHVQLGLAQISKPRVLRAPNATEQILALTAVAIAPFDCPGTLNCEISERTLVGHLRSRERLRVTESARVAQLLFERNLASDALFDPATGPGLLEELGVSALVVPRILEYHRVDGDRGHGPGVELRAELELVAPGLPPIAKGSDSDGGPDLQIAGKSPLSRIFARVAKAIFANIRQP
ncbi:MAG: hypothetical protein KJZ57_13085, partial [Anaerolineales bacterium]|nr:hypothetical protein [Anaerolineales bacterium]